MTLPWLAQVLRDAGLHVIEHPAWRAHSRPGPWSPRYGVVHATAAPRSQLDSVQVGVVRNGRGDLAGPIANATIDRRGVWHVLSAGRCNSTLPGTAGPFRGYGNTYALSTEGANDNTGEPWPAEQYESYVRGWAAWCRRLGWRADHLVGHKEHTPGRKTDPTFDMAKFRRDVAALLAGEDTDMDATQSAQLANASYAVTSIPDLTGRTDPKTGKAVRVPLQTALVQLDRQMDAALRALGVDMAAIKAQVAESTASLTTEVNEVAGETVSALADAPADEAVALLIATVGQDRVRVLWEAMGARLGAAG